MLRLPFGKEKFVERRATPRLTVSEISESLIQLQVNLDTLKTQKKGHLERLAEEQAQLEMSINAETEEKDRAIRIHTNIVNILK